MEFKNNRNKLESRIDLVYYKLKDELNVMKLIYPCLIVFNIFFFVLCGYDINSDNILDGLNKELFIMWIISFLALIFITPYIFKRIKKLNIVRKVRENKNYEGFDDFSIVNNYKTIRNLEIVCDESLFGVEDYHASEVYRKLKNNEIVNIYIEKEKKVIKNGLFFYYDDFRGAYLVIDLEESIIFEEIDENGSYIFDINKKKFYKGEKQ